MNAASSPIRIVAVDDHPLFREGISAVLALQPDMELVGEGESGEDAIALYRRLLPDILLIDLQMPGIGGIKAIAAIVAEFPAARIVVLTTYKRDVQATRALQAGATSYLVKSTVRKELISVIRFVHEGSTYIHSAVTRSIREHLADESLSGREIQVLSLVASGLSNKRIAINMSISLETVKTHMRNILAKLNVKDRTEAAVVALRRGILED